MLTATTNKWHIKFAAVAQLVESISFLLRVASSSPVCRSTIKQTVDLMADCLFFIISILIRGVSTDDTQPEAMLLIIQQ